MQELKSYLETLSPGEIESILASPTVTEAFSEETADDLGLTFDDVHTYMKELAPKPQIQVIEDKKRIVQIWDLGESYKKRERKGILMNRIYEVLESSEGGETMTGILLSMGKNNGHWRPIAKNILDYMHSKGDVVKVGSQYYLKKSNIHRESEFHRIVFKEILSNGPISTSAILNNIGYRNPRGYAKIRPVLDMMAEEGFIRHEDKRWHINE